MSRVALVTATALVVGTIVIACGGNDGETADPAEAASAGQAAAFNLTSSAFASSDEIPVRYTCEGEDVSPDLAWSEPPEGTASFALVMDDSDAPGGTFTHWLAWDFGPDFRDHPENTPGPAEGESSFGETGYGGPCPPRGDESHRYALRFYALDAPLELEPGAAVGDFEGALEGHVLGVAELVGTFARE